MLRIFTIITAILFCSNLVVAQNDIAVLAEGCSLQGKRSFLKPGIYRANQLGIKDNSLSSFYLPDGMALQVFESDSYRGKTETFYSSVSCLNYSWTNRVSSVKLFWASDPSNQGNNGFPPMQGNNVIVYRDRNYSGPFVVLQPGNFGSGMLGQLTGNISSIYIPRGMAVKIIDRNNQSLVLNASTVDLGLLRWDKRIWSGFIDGNYTGGVPGNIIPPQGSRVILYRDPNFKGPSRTMDEGVFTATTLGSLASQVSSIYIPYGATLQAFDKYGKTQHFSSSINDLGLYGWANKIYSGAIYSVNPTQQTVSLYADPNFRGRMVACKEGRTEYIANNPGISSIEVPQGFVITVFSGPNLTGNYRTFTKSVNSLSAFPGWDNRVMSVFVFRL
jgi:hypothetical protein